MAYGTVALDTLQSSTAGVPTQFNDGNGVQVGTLCRAWVNFNGVSGSVAIRASFNVSSITRNGSGDYTVTFTNAMPDVNYVTLLDSITVYNGTAGAYYNSLSTYLTTSVRVGLFGGENSGGSSYDGSIVSVAVFR